MSFYFGEYLRIFRYKNITSPENDKNRNSYLFHYDCPLDDTPRAHQWAMTHCLRIADVINHWQYCCPLGCRKVGGCAWEGCVVCAI